MNREQTIPYAALKEAKIEPEEGTLHASMDFNKIISPKIFSSIFRLFRMRRQLLHKGLLLDIVFSVPREARRGFSQCCEQDICILFSCK